MITLRCFDQDNPDHNIEYGFLFTYVCLFVCLSVCLSAQKLKNYFSESDVT